MGNRSIEFVFQSTLPAKGATFKQGENWDATVVSIHAPREGSDRRATPRKREDRVSIHAPREGSDLQWRVQKLLERVSIHAPREGSDVEFYSCLVRVWVFQSTLPAKGATGRCGSHRYVIAGFQSTLPAKGATRCNHQPRGKSQFQSTLPAKGATWVCGGVVHQDTFQSTLPAKGATLDRCVCGHQWHVSIHAPREGSDGASLTGSTVKSRFNPRSPRRERRWALILMMSPGWFQSTLPAKGATDGHVTPAQPMQFQSTLPAKGATLAARSAA